MRCFIAFNSALVIGREAIFFWQAINYGRIRLQTHIPLKAIIKTLDIRKRSSLIAVSFSIIDAKIIAS